MNTVQLANIINQYIGEVSTPFSSIDERCRDILYREEVESIPDTLTEQIDSISENLPSGGGGYTLQDYVNDGGKFSYTTINQNIASGLSQLQLNNITGRMFYTCTLGNYNIDLNCSLTGNCAYMFGACSGGANYKFILSGSPSAINQLFNSCINVTHIDCSSLNTSTCTSLQNTFNNCSALTWLDISGWDCSRVTATVYFLRLINNCTTLIGNHTLSEVEAGTITTCNGLKVDLNLSESVNNIERKDLLAIIKGLADLTGSTSKTLTLSSTLRNKLEQSDIDILTDKNWNLAIV